MSLDERARASSDTTTSAGARADGCVGDVQRTKPFRPRPYALLDA